MSYYGDKIQDGNIVYALFEPNLKMKVKFSDSLNVYCEWREQGRLKQGAYAKEDILIHKSVKNRRENTDK